MKKQLATSRVTKSGVLLQDEKLSSLGVTYDVNQKIYDYLNSASLADAVEFHEEYIQSPPRVYLVIGKKEDINWEELKKLGEVKQLTLEEVFGY